MNDLLMLCYHALSATWSAPRSTTPARFERQMALLSERGYRGVTFSEAVSAHVRGRAVAVTFDDAYRSVIELARGILDRFGLPATVFAPTDFVGETEPLRFREVGRPVPAALERELEVMTWPELSELASGGWEIGSHTGSHPRLTTLDDAELDNELGRSKAACERHLGACTSLAYPYGDFDERVVAAAERAGYAVAATLPQGRLPRGSALAWPRIGVYHIDDDFRFRLKVSPALRRVRGSAPEGALGAAARVAGRVM